MKLHGKVIKKTPIEFVGKDQGIAKQSLVIEEVLETETKYPNRFLIDFIKDRTERSNRVSEGQLVDVEFGSRVSEYNGKNYGNLNGNKITPVSSNGGLVTQSGEELPR